MRRRKEGGTLKLIGFLIYLVFGLYLLNIRLAFIKLPESFVAQNNLIYTIAGALLIIGGITWWLAFKKKNPYADMAGWER